MLEGSLASDVIFTGSLDGRFAFSRFQTAFDGMFAIAKTLELLAQSGFTLPEAMARVPSRSYHSSRVPCVWEMKGGIMRKMSEDSIDKEASFIDGIKVQLGESWVLVLPDQYHPYIHIVAEAAAEKDARKLLADYQAKVEQWKKELQ
jgi:mannose-1-phosphate guanylyltransferase/phosphomannomutase